MDFCVVAIGSEAGNKGRGAKVGLAILTSRLHGQGVGGGSSGLAGALTCRNKAPEDESFKVCVYHSLTFLAHKHCQLQAKHL